MTSKKLIISLVLVVASGLAIGTSLIRSNHNKNKTNKKAEASSSQFALTSQSDWQSGTLSNVDSTSNPGSLKIDSLAETTVDLVSVAESSITASYNMGSRKNAIDGNNATFWNAGPGAPEEPVGYWWQVDIGSEKTVNKVSDVCTSATPTKYYGSNTGMTCTTGISSGCDGTLLATLAACGAWPAADVTTFTPASFRYFAIWVPDDKVAYEINLSSPATATHTSGATQITDANLYQWQTFTPTYTKPANTDITFKFRTSKNGSDGWTAWTTPQTVASGSPLDITSLVQSKSGDPGSEEFYKYFQVETTLTSTDGISTSTLSDYSIGYHTNRPPDKPTAMTAIIGN